jgi:TolB protein
MPLLLVRCVTAVKHQSVHPEHFLPITDYRLRITRSVRQLTALLCVAVAGAAIPTIAQRRPVLPQIDEPHPYYYRELYLPQLTSGPSSLTWGPDSKELIYSMAGSLWRQKLDSKEAVQLTDSAGYDYQPDWSPDGQRVVYVSYQKDAMELWLLDLAGGETIPLTSGGAINVEPRWSPDGTRLVWVSTLYNRRFHVFIADFSGSELKNVTRLTGETKSSLPRYYYSAYDMEINPVWTRDGHEILFVSNKGHIYGTGGFWLMKAEPGAEAREIHYEETSWKARPDFSPDGSRMIYSSYLGRQWQNLWVMPAKGGDSFPLSYSDWDETNPRWSADGSKIAYLQNRGGIPAIHWKELDRGVTQAKTEEDDLNTDNRKYLHHHGKIWIGLEGRIAVTDELGRSFAPLNAWIQADDGYDRSERHMERHYFHSGHGEKKELEVPAGKYVVEVTRGLEVQPFRAVVEVAAGDYKTVHARREDVAFNDTRWEHWVASDLHVHMNYGGTYRNGPDGLVADGDDEGLDMIHQLTVNKEQRMPDIEFPGFKNPNDPLHPVGRESFVDQDRLIVQGQEFHTSYWGHRGILRLRDHLLLPGYAGYPNTAAASLYPMNADVYDMAHAQGALIGAVHPFDEIPDPFAKPAQQITDELPIDVALGKLDYMEIVGFSDHKSTAAVWYKLLNLGFKLPAGGGTDATTNYAAPIRGQVGFDRVYVWTPGWPSTIETWMDGLTRGRTFATNGPLLEFKLNNEMLGTELKFDAPQSSVPFFARLRSIVPVDHLELVCNGKTVRELKLYGDRQTTDVTGTIPLNESGWCVLRAWSDKAEYPVMDNYAYATTSPIYVAIGGKRAYSKEDSEYFEAWIDRTIEITGAYPDWNSPQEKQYVLNRLREARAVFTNLK